MNNLPKISEIEESLKPDPWAGQIFTLADAYKEREPLQYLVEGLLTLPSLSILFGAPASLKSLLLADLAASVVGGLPWISREVIQSPIMWLDFDNGPRRTHERIAALCRGRDLPEDAPFFYLSMPTTGLDASKAGEIRRLLDMARERGVKLICMDNLSLIAGMADENSAAMVPVMSGLRMLAECSGAAVVVIHHQRKSNGIKGRAGEALRGHSSIEAALDLALLVEREDRCGIATIKSTKTRDVDVLPFGAEFVYEHKTGTKELDTAFFRSYETDDLESDGAVESTIADVLSESPLLKQGELVTKVKGQGIETGKHRIRALIDRMVDRGRVVITTGRRRAILYSLVPDPTLPE